MTDTDNAPNEPQVPPAQPQGSHDPVLPQWAITGISVVMTILFVINIIADIFVPGYSGYPTTALLGVLVGSVLGIERFLRVGR